MSPVIYEEHRLSDPNFPALFHIGCIDRGRPVLTHWHENLETLLVLDGEADITIDGEVYHARPGQLVITNSNCLHSVSATDDKFKYYCLIIGKRFCDMHGFRLNENSFCPLNSGNGFMEKFNEINREINEKDKYYKQRIQALIIELLVSFYRNFGNDFSSDRQNKSLAAVKSAIRFIFDHLCEPVGIDEICSHIGYSKYYLCHTFKEATGLTIIDFINLQRCRYAAVLLRQDNAAIGEVAAKTGFQSASYFSKIYKKYMGDKPSAKKQNDN